MKKSAVFKFMAFLLLLGVIVFVEGCGSGYETVMRMAESTFNERAGGSVCFFRYNYVEDHAMRYLMMIGIVTAICGCGPGEPSLSEVERGMKESFIRQTGNFAVRLTSHAKKIGAARWSVWLTVEQNGGCRTLHATAVMDKNGDLHYYVD